MRKILSLFILTSLLVPAFLLAQEKKSWKEMHDFHAVMSATFHPSEEGKLEPIRSRSQEMTDKAVLWQKSTAPAGYNKNAVEKSLKKLVDGCQELNKLVKAKAKDDVIKKKLSEMHNVFHEIMEKCEKEEHKDEH
jgi:hypothetical protein